VTAQIGARGLNLVGGIALAEPDLGIVGRPRMSCELETSKKNEKPLLPQKHDLRESEPFADHDARRQRRQSLRTSAA
jgi:hypothetical protein